MEETKEKLKEILKWVGVIGAGFAGWKISASILGLGSALSGFGAAVLAGDKGGMATAGAALATKLKKACGVALMAAGASLDISVAIESWADGVSWDCLVDQLKAAGLLHLGGFLVGGATGMGIGAILDGVLTVIPSIKSAVVDGNEAWSNTLSIVKGISTIAGGLAVITGSWIPLAIGGVIATIAVVLIYLDDIWAFIKTLPQKIKDFFSPLSDWINTNIIQPIIRFFTPILDAIREVGVYAKQKYTEIKDGVVLAVTSIWNKIVEIKNKIVEIFSALWGAFKTYVWTPIVNAVSAFYNTYIAPIVNAISAGFSYVWGKFKEHVWDKIIGFFAELKNKLLWVRDQAAAIFKNIGTFVVDFISGLFRKVINGVFYLIENFINGFIRMLNGAIGIINKIPGVNITTVGYLSIPRLAEGGIVDAGQMFIAREAGPELVGNIGRKTAVANNDQIISGIEGGVYRAMMAANAGAGGKAVTVNATFEIDGEVVGRKVIKYHNGVVMQTGASPLLV